MTPFSRQGESLVDNWSSLGPQGHAYPFSRVAYARELLSNYITDGTLNLSELGDLVPDRIATCLTRLGGGPRDILVWRVASDSVFSFASAKKYLKSPLNQDLDALLG